jgi:hypothetical protein
MREFYIGHTEIIFGCEMDRDAVIKANSVKEAIEKLKANYIKKRRVFGMVTEMMDTTDQDQDEHFGIEIAEFAE